MHDREEEIAELQRQRSGAYQSIREEYNLKLKELSTGNRKVFESMQRTKDQQAEQMRLYQAELQEKKKLDLEAKRLKENETGLKDRIVTLEGLVKENDETTKLLNESLTEMMSKLDKASQKKAKELEDLIDCINLVIARGPKGDKALPATLKEKVNEDNLKKLRSFLELYKVKL